MPASSAYPYGQPSPPVFHPSIPSHGSRAKPPAAEPSSLDPAFDRILFSVGSVPPGSDPHHRAGTPLRGGL